MEKLDVITKKVDVLPMVKYYMDQLGIYDLFAKYVQNPMRSPVDSAQILSIMVANIVQIQFIPNSICNCSIKIRIMLFITNIFK